MTSKIDQHAQNIRQQEQQDTEAKAKARAEKEQRAQEEKKEREKQEALIKAAIHKALAQIREEISEELSKTTIIPYCAGSWYFKARKINKNAGQGDHLEYKFIDDYGLPFEVRPVLPENGDLKTSSILFDVVEPGRTHIQTGKTAGGDTFFVSSKKDPDSYLIRNASNEDVVDCILGLAAQAKIEHEKRRPKYYKKMAGSCLKTSIVVVGLSLVATYAFGAEPEPSRPPEAKPGKPTTLYVNDLTPKI